MFNIWHEFSGKLDNGCVMFRKDEPVRRTSSQMAEMTPMSVLTLPTVPPIPPFQPRLPFASAAGMFDRDLADEGVRLNWRIFRHSLSSLSLSEAIPLGAKISPFPFLLNLVLFQERSTFPGILAVPPLTFPSMSAAAEGSAVVADRT
jgi:hypothetical protein